MARITVEDCIDAIPNRFELVLLAAERARALGSGAVSQIAEDRDKRPVVALREIAEGNVSPEVLRDDYINRFRRVDPDELSGMMLDELDPDARYVPKQDPSWQDGVQAQFDKTEPSDLELSELEPFAVEQATTEPLVADWAYARGGRTVSEAT